MKRNYLLAPLFVAVLVASGCHLGPEKCGHGLTGAWRGDVRVISGAYAVFKDVKFMYDFNRGGTVTESSNYDAAPPGSPAYGVWRRTGPQQFEARYEFYTAKPPASFDDLAKGGGWMPDGHGVLTEKILLAADGNHFDSTIKYELFDAQGHSVAGGGEASVKAERISF